ncbi:hypothetical protein [Erwinia mallotivora]|uniref:hypothetical protein n=1 Tax=Erwinia mallotivora TaxID=69222 RepID=UPI0004B205C1|nr:hypothetical protein [Erwinia mallotivora]
MNIRLTPDVFDLLMKKSRLEGMGAAALMCKIITDYLKGNILKDEEINEKGTTKSRTIA